MQEDKAPLAATFWASVAERPIALPPVRSGERLVRNYDPDQGVGIVPVDTPNMEWQPITIAPYDRDLELAVIDYDGTHALVFPCRRLLHGWIDSKTVVREERRFQADLS